MKPEGEQETPGCRLTGAVADKVKQGIRGEGAGGGRGEHAGTPPRLEDGKPWKDGRAQCTR